MTDFAALLRCLAEADIEHILVGGAAATAHGSARLTQNLEIVYCRSEENVRRLVYALAPHRLYLRGAPPGLPFVWDARTLHHGLNFTLITDLGAIDLLGEIVGGGRYEDLLPNSITITVFGSACHCLGLQRLIQVKRAAGRPRDLEAVAELEAILEERDARNDS